jgi:hypothetical protein
MTRTTVALLIASWIGVSACQATDEPSAASPAVVSQPAASTPGHSIELQGSSGSSAKWRSGWLDLNRPTTFSSGSKLRLKIGGSAKTVLVRLLPLGGSATEPEGILGDAVSVPEDRVVEIELDHQRTEIKQISVHGGANPFGEYPLSPDNGAATLLHAELITP